MEKHLTGIYIEVDTYKGKEFFITVKGKEIRVGAKLSYLKSLFPNSYKYYKLFLENNYSVSFRVMIPSEYRSLEFYFDSIGKIKEINISDLEQ